MLRRKLIAAFSVMALLTALSGAVAFFFVNRTGGVVTVFSDVTQPLAKASLQLSANADLMIKSVLKPVTENGPLEPASRELEALDREGRDIVDKMRGYTTDGNVQIDFAGLERNHAEFVATLKEILVDETRGRAAAAINTGRQTELRDDEREIYQLLTQLTRRIDGLISEREEAVKIQLQLGSATVDTLGQVLTELLTVIYPVQRYASQLLVDLAVIEDIARQAPRLDEKELAKARGEAEERFGRISRTLDKAGPRLREQGAEDEFRRAKAKFAEFADTLRSLFVSQMEVLSARAQIVAGRQHLDTIERTYADILQQIGRQTENLNQDAKANAKSSVLAARNVIAGSSLLALMAAIYFAFSFAQRISSPLIRLSGHAAAIRQSGKLEPLPDESVNTRPDEIGQLARSFNDLVVDLADARERLIEWSEAEIKAQFERLDAAVNNMPIGLSMFDAAQKLIICNARFAEIYRLDAALTKPGTSLRAILTHRDENGIYADANGMSVDERLADISSGKPWHQVNELSDGRIIAIAHHPLANGGSIATHEDITERRKAEQRIAYMAHHDALTDLPNRVSFREAIVEALVKARGENPVAIQSIDLDHFKAVNDTLGHPIGDALLKQVALRLLDCVRDADTVARLGGDEFAIIQVGADQPVAATSLATRLIEEISKPYQVEGHQIVIGASVGITVAPADGTDPDLLLKKADMALYRAKQIGRGSYSFFEASMDAEMQARRLLELDLRAAVTLGQFELYYQPTVNVDDGTISGFEALLRWRHPERGLIMPLDFIPLAEEIGLINQIGAWVLKKACHQAVDWPDQINVAVNVSPVQFKGRALVLDVIAALGASGLPARRLEIEITEAVLLNDTEATITTLNELRDLGVRIAMDDFGTGYSSLGYLQKFPFDKIKIDRSFIHDLPEKSDSRAIVRAVAGLGSTLGIATTAEGVETEDELNELRREGCTEVQGYLFSRPRPAADLAAFIREFEAKRASAA